jgi:hypothetical protein
MTQLKTLEIKQQLEVMIDYILTNFQSYRNIRSGERFFERTSPLLEVPFDG